MFFFGLLLEILTEDDQWRYFRQLFESYIIPVEIKFQQFVSTYDNGDRRGPFLYSHLISRHAWHLHERVVVCCDLTVVALIVALLYKKKIKSPHTIKQYVSSVTRCRFTHSNRINSIFILILRWIIVTTQNCD